VRRESGAKPQTVPDPGLQLVGLGELVVLETLERLSKPIKRVRNESDARDVLRLMAGVRT